ncbi:MAG: hypothetical protein Q8P88_03290 [Candidatus Jorgensenbacteria bacterium]|nr:hypothetical protein [Candidatus Jorgensenbacteria bacterium]
MRSYEKRPETVPTFMEQLRGIVGLVFENKAQVEDYINNISPDILKETKEDSKEMAVREFLEDFAAAIDVDPRVGEREVCAREIRERFQVMSSHEERVAFLRGFADFRRNQYAHLELRSKIEKAEEKEENIHFDHLDDLVVSGGLYRDIVDSQVMDSAVGAGIDFGRRYETASGRKVLSGLKDEYERMINAGKGYGGNELNDIALADKLRESGFVVQANELRYTLKERAEE